jgi:hypothetical protein
MNIYQWIAIILLADVLLVLFVRGSDERRSTEIQHRECEQ